jgi:hypothetical protein
MPSTRRGTVASNIQTIPIPPKGKAPASGGYTVPVYTGGKFDHDHWCPSCGHLWGHDPDPFWLSGEPGGHEANVKAHTCEKCGTEQWIKHYGDAGPVGGWFNADDKAMHQSRELNTHQKEDHAKQAADPMGSFLDMLEQMFGKDLAPPRAHRARY